MSKWYVVWVGAEPGIYDSWDECKDLVEGFPGAKYKAYNTFEGALNAYRGDYNDEIKILRTIAAGPATRVNYEAIDEIPRGSVAVDAACSGNPGVMEYRGVDIDTGAEIFHKKFALGTNNIGEFLAIVHALAFFEQRGMGNITIFSDSKIAQGWVAKKSCGTKLAQSDATATLLEVVRRAENWLHTHTPTNPIKKWKTDEWGEIPADFGRK
ncbi:MAG: viroplasmin family protein [Muribaculaceae bacterium]|nr:viroplasmin family protein [Muribaculaceae bacterium]